MRAGLCFLIFAMAAPIAHAESDLLNRTSKEINEAALRCCPDGESDAARCVDVLTRNPDDKASACAALVGMSQLKHTGDRAGCLSDSAADRSLIGITTREMRDKGWYQDGAPKVMQGAALFPADYAAAGSPACLAPQGAKPGEMEAYQKACAARGGYESVHLYLSIAHDISDDMAAQASAEDPWWKSKKKYYNDHVFLVRSEKREDIQKMTANLLKECKIVSYLYVSSHGASASISWGKNGANGSETLTAFLKSTLSPCLFAPGAQLQFDGCNMGCGTGAEALRQGFDHLFDGSDYRAFGTRFPKGDPFEGLAVYLNTDLGYNSTPGGFARFFGAKAKTWSGNGIGVVLSRGNGAFSSDIPTDKVPACKKEGQPMSPWMFDDVARGL